MSPSIFKYIQSMLNKLSPQAFAKNLEEGNVVQFSQMWASLSEQDKEKFITTDHYLYLHMAAEYGRLDMIDDFLNHLNQNALSAFQAREFEGFKIALQNQHWDVVERILSEEQLHKDCLQIIQTSDEFLELVWHSKLQNVITLIFNQACYQNTTELKRILKIVPKTHQHLLLMTEKVELTNDFQINLLSPLQASCQYGNLNILKFIWGLYDTRVQKGLMNSHFPQCMLEAIEYGHANIVKRLLEWLTPEQQIKILSHEDFNLLTYAADRGFEHVVELIWSYIPASERITAISANNYAAYRMAKHHNHTQTINLLEVIVPPHLKGKMQKAHEHINP
ncbi:ankyrin repeat domain-containing protein [Candidatus Berkiella aquae]|uniref:Ankyrin repeat domain-containing protein n=1 Tax=Candidatus Berkiella aquae TaxID=295108 RepID=A0A0Q9YPL7_9GAMM|nr:ankyrin repeat domain-containing protein [Candidatus Berkiella aquae]MCS5711882.1 ankyrin repeat domain-containing protein [Candidatus Berkiella aquae]